MKIALVLDTTLDSDAGVQQYFKGLARYLLIHGHTVRFIVPPSPNCSEFESIIISFGKNIRVKGNANTIQTTLPVDKKQIEQMMVREQFDIVHIAAPFSPFFGAKVIDAAKCPTVLSYMVYSKTDFYRWLTAQMGIILRETYRKIDAHIAISEAAQKEANQTIPGEYSVIPVGIVLETYKGLPIVKDSDNKKTILFLGRLDKRKGVEFLIRAYNRVNKACPNTRLLICGDGPERKKLEKLCKKLNSQDIIFEGYISEEDKPGYLNAATLCVFPAVLGESFGVVILEAMACGKVVLVFDNPGYRSILGKFPDLVVENRNVEKLADRITTFLTFDDKRHEYEEKIKQDIQSYSWNTVGKKIERVYQELLSGKPKST